jgi:hypothetical protein
LPFLRLLSHFIPVLRCDLTEIGLDDVGGLRRAKGARVGAGTVVLLALGDEQSLYSVSLEFKYT